MPAPPSSWELLQYALIVVGYIPKRKVSTIAILDMSVNAVVAV